MTPQGMSNDKREALRFEITERILKNHPDISEKELERKVNFRLNLKLEMQAKHSMWVNRLKQEGKWGDVSEITKKVAEEFSQKNKERSK